MERGKGMRMGMRIAVKMRGKTTMKKKKTMRRNQRQILRLVRIAKKRNGNQKSIESGRAVCQASFSVSQHLFSIPYKNNLHNFNILYELKVCLHYDILVIRCFCLRRNFSRVALNKMHIYVRCDL